MKLSEWIKKCVPKKAGINTSSSAFEPLSDAHAAYIKNLVEMAGKRMRDIRSLVLPNINTA